MFGFLIKPMLPSDFNELNIDIGGWNARYAFIVNTRFLPSNFWLTNESISIFPQLTNILSHIL